ncbi:hypothetical protein GCM10007203_26630 [Staphylococcus nepalensis]|nr:hypothetical protein GCM10007203_26630 [Staphylococcus nepalensis]
MVRVGLFDIFTFKDYRVLNILLNVVNIMIEKILKIFKNSSVINTQKLGDKLNQFGLFL